MKRSCRHLTNCKLFPRERELRTAGTFPQAAAIPQLIHKCEDDVHAMWNSRSFAFRFSSIGFE